MIVSSDGFLIVAGETIVMVLFIILTLLIGMVLGGYSQMGFMMYLFAQQVWGVVAMIRALTGERR